jgi:hypothetical protein
MTALPAEQRPPVEWPEGFDGRALFRQLNHSAITSTARAAREFRRALTRANPLLFALIYLRHHLRQQDTGLCSFSMFHVKHAQRVVRWATPFGFYDIDVAPRGSAKSTWGFQIDPLWVGAHGHRQFFLGFSYNEDMAQGQLDSLRDELTDNPLLLLDFPGLAPRNRSRSDIATKGGMRFAARTLKGTSLGLKKGAARPDVMVGDDLEPMESDYGPELKAKIQNKLIQAFLPMGAPHAVVQLFGTTTMYGGLMHEAVRAARGEAVAPWIDAFGFDCRHWAAILDEGTEAERSLWPPRWSLQWLKDLKRKDPRYYALQYANDPATAPAEGFWSEKLFRYEAPTLVQRRIIYVDPAMSVSRTSDNTAVVVASLSVDGRRAYIEHAEMGKWRGDELRQKLWQLTAWSETLPGPPVRQWWVEKNQGADTWHDILAERPPGVRLVLDRAEGHKKDRIHAALKLYHQDKVRHACVLEQLQQQACTWQPWSKEDDLLDALAGALRQLFGAVGGHR